MTLTPIIEKVLKHLLYEFRLLSKKLQFDFKWGCH
jgi:hypothetical protein